MSARQPRVNHYLEHTFQAVGRKIHSPLLLALFLQTQLLYALETELTCAWTMTVRVHQEAVGARSATPVMDMRGAAVRAYNNRKYAPQ
jgi:hypothetical protein